MFKLKKVKERGFTLIEILIVIAIIAILSAVVMPSLNFAREAAMLAKAKKELRTIHESLELYKGDHSGNYPLDAIRGLPIGLEEYLTPGILSDAAWPGSVFDWDAWEFKGEKIYQISIRFCPVGEPENCRFPQKDWADNFGINSSVFYCIEGPCRAHISNSPDYPGYCVNCTEPEYPYGIYD